MIKAINDLLVPLGVRLPQTDREIVGGYFIWLTLPDGMEGGALVERAREDENVVVAQVRTDGAMVMGTADSNTHPGRAV
jgi:DNA-binding transcriptional MocR family regulator